MSDRMGLPVASEGPEELSAGRSFFVDAQASGPTEGGERDDLGRLVLRAELRGNVTIRAGSQKPKQLPALIRDVALIARQPNPLNSQATVTLLYGLFGRGTYGATRVFSDPALSAQNYSFLTERFAGLDRFWLLFWVPCDRSAPRPIDSTPDLTDPDIVILGSETGSAGVRPAS